MFQIKDFFELSTTELYQILQLRQRVFMLEQNSLYDDIDDQDIHAWHYLLKGTKAELVGYGRVREPHQGLFKIERIVMSVTYRGQGLAKQLIQQMLTDIFKQAPKVEITLSAQTSILSFYTSLRFEVCGEPFDDGGIEHINMRYVG